MASRSIQSWTAKVVGSTLETKILLGILIITAVARIPSLFEPYWYGDEAIYLTLGEGVRQGLVLYKDIFDHKPPAIYLLAAAAGSVFWFRLILLFWSLISTVLFWELAKNLFGQKMKPVILATSVFVFLTTIPLLEGNIANSEIFMIGPTIGAFLILLAAKKQTPKRLLAAGLLFSLATLFKVPAALDFATLVVFWLFSLKLIKKELIKIAKDIALVTLGFLGPIFLTFLYFWLNGAFAQYLDVVWSQNLTYISRWDVPTVTLATTIAQAGLTTRVLIFVVVISFIFIFRKRFSPPSLFTSLWFTFALFASLLSGRPYPHYLIQVVPPLALLTALVVFGKEKYRFLPVPLLLLFLASLVFYKFYYYPVFSYYRNFLSFISGQQTKGQYLDYFDKRVATIYKLAKVINERTSRKDRVFIWGTAPELYALSRRLPSGRYVTSFHIKDFSGEEETLKALAQRRPRYIIVFKNETAPFPEFFRFLQSNYLYLESVDNAQLWKSLNSRPFRKDAS